MTTLLDFLEVWQDLKVADLNNKQLKALQDILISGIGEVGKEIAIRIDNGSVKVNKEGELIV